MVDTGFTGAIALPGRLLKRLNLHFVAIDTFTPDPRIRTAKTQRTPRWERGNGGSLVDSQPHLRGVPGGRSPTTFRACMAALAPWRFIRFFGLGLRLPRARPLNSQGTQE